MFLSFEGIDFSGKTTQIVRLARWFTDRNQPVTLVREPGGVAISEHIRALLLDPEQKTMHPVTEMLLFSSARSQLVHEIIKPALETRTHVIADRFFDSTTAYQGYGRGLDVSRILSLNQIAAHDIEPDLTLVLDITVDESLRRRAAAGRKADRMELANTDFFERVRRGYYALAERYPSRIRLLDGTQPEEDIAAMIRTLITDWEGQTGA